MDTETLGDETVKVLSAALARITLPEPRHHVLLCTGGRCATSEIGENAWRQLKQRIAADRLPVLRTRVECLRICAHGPIAVVYPQGTWYAAAHGDNLGRIIDQHLKSGQIIEDLRIGDRPLTS